MNIEDEIRRASAAEREAADEDRAAEADSLPAFLLALTIAAASALWLVRWPLAASIAALALIGVQS